MRNFACRFLAFPSNATEVADTQDVTLNNSSYSEIVNMDSWVVGQISFWFTVRKVKPTQIVDKAIEIFLDIMVPGRGAGQSTWYVVQWFAKGLHY
jgi:hypothetical protein